RKRPTSSIAYAGHLRVICESSASHLRDVPAKDPQICRKSVAKKSEVIGSCQSLDILHSLVYELQRDPVLAHDIEQLQHTSHFLLLFHLFMNEPLKEIFRRKVLLFPAGMNKFMYGF